VAQERELVMTIEEINDLCAWVRKGGIFYIGRNYVGRQKIKVPYGPFGLFSKLYDVDERIMAIIRQKIEIQRLVKRKARLAIRYQAPLRSQTQHAH
jgi:hypothetical protein